MNIKNFKKQFSTLAKENQFQNISSGWYKESDKSIVILSLQKSNYGEIYYLNLKIFIQNIFGTRYTVDKTLVKNDTGDVFRRQPQDFDELFNFEIKLSDEERFEQLRKLFDEFIEPFVKKALTIEGINELASDGQLNLLPNVKEELSKLQ